MIALVRLIDAHKGAFEYDWRTRFHGASVDDIGETMTFGEAIRLTERLSRDPGSEVAAAIAGWEYPVTREAIVAMNKFDFDHRLVWLKNGKKGAPPEPHPRPWPTGGDGTRRRGNAAGRSPEQVRQILNAHGHSL